MNLESVLNREIEEKRGVLRTKPAFVARASYPGLGRLGLRRYSAGKRGWLCERWMCSSVVASGPTQLENEGLSELDIEGAKLFSRDALNLCPEKMLGGRYARFHSNRFGVLTKILDIGRPIPWHLHAREEHARKYYGMNPKEEAYYFLDHPNKGPLPYSHLGMHPDVTREELLEILKRWNDDKVLDLSPAYRLNVGEGFHILAGVVHAPGTALTLEAQEESDVGTLFQPLVEGKILPKEKYLLNGPRTEEEAIELIDWDVCTDPKFYRKYHILPETISEDRTLKEYWIYSPKRSRKFSGKEVRLAPRKKVKRSEKGAFLFLAWKGRGSVNGTKVAGGTPGVDELFVTYDGAVEHEIENEGNEELVFYTIFGPDVYGS
jgi:hypothetical protein